jgi:hypothetical protein
MGRISQTFKICLALLFAVLSTNLLPVYASALTAPSTDTQTQKVDICHSAGQSGNYTINEIDTSAVDEFNNTGKNGHGDHSADIIPPFVSSPDGVVFSGKNWDATGQAIYANDCVVPTQYYLSTSHLVACGAITITLRNVSPWVYPVSYSTDGTTPDALGPNYGPVVNNSGVAPDDQTGTKTLTFTEDQNGGTVTVKYVVAAGTESDLYKNLPVGQVTTVVVDTDCKEPPVNLDRCETYPLIHATNNDLNGWSLVQGASFVDGGIKLSSPGDWTSAKISRNMTGTLADLGTGISYTPDTLYLGLHVQTAEGTLVYETAYGGNWWLDESTASANMKANAPHQGGGQGSNYYGTLQEWAAAFPELQVEKLTVLYTSPTPASTTVTSVKIGCKEYTFDYERVVQECTVGDNTYRDSWEFDGYTYPEADDYSGVVNNATFQFTNEGLHISTPDTASYAFGLIDGGNTPLADVGAMSYKTFRKEMSAGYEQTLPAYILYVDMNGDAPNGETYFFYEPYNNGAVVEGTWQTWDAINGGNAKWWMSGTGQQLQTWSYFVGQFPDAVVLAYGFNQGTSNAETYAIIQDIEFDCATTNFAAPQVLGEETTNPTPTGPTVIVPTTAAVLPAQIAATGGDNSNEIGMLAAVLVGGLTYFLVLRRQSSYEL